MTGKRVNVRQNTSKICSEPTKGKDEYGPIADQSQVAQKAEGGV
jgi:hypothetical protein